ncbi:MAG: cytochrome P450 [Solirubrobacterales bacterium]
MSRRLPPGPSYPSLVQAVGFWKRPLAFLETCRARYGKRFTIKLPFAPPFVFLTDPAEIKQIYTAPPDVLHPGEGARVLEPVVGANSLILLDGDPHMEQRKLMLPAFHGERIERLTGLIEEVAERELDSWGTEPEVTLGPRMQELTLEIILRAVFGLDPGERLDAVRARLQELLAFGDHPLTLFGPPSEAVASVLNRVGPLAGFFDLRDDVDRLLFALIDERRSGDGDRADVLTMLLEARHEDGSPMSDQELRDELMTLLVAGHETTATSVSWAFERLTREPVVLDRLVSEVDSGDEAYLTATIQETLRRRPVLPNTAPRLVKKPIEVGGWRYQPDVCLVANAYLVHHDPEIYDDPYSFRPERFIDNPPGTYTWIPFGGGRRRCLGASFAMLEMKVVLRAVLSRYAVRTLAAPERARRRNITIRPADGARVGVTAREGERESVPA